DGPAGVRFDLAASADVAEPDTAGRRLTPSDGPWMGHENRQEIMLSLEAGRLSLNAWSGQGGARAPFRAGAGDGVAALTQADRAVRAALAFGRFALSAETGLGDRRMMFRPVEADAASYARVGAGWAGERLRLNFAAGELDERLAPLGGFLPSGSPYALPSRTRFISAGWGWRVRDGLDLWGEGGVGRTEANGPMLGLDDEALSSTWRLGAAATCSSLGWGCRSLSLELSQPLRIETGTFGVLLADAPEDYFDP